MSHKHITPSPPKETSTTRWTTKNGFRLLTHLATFARPYELEGTIPAILKRANEKWNRKQLYQYLVKTIRLEHTSGISTPLLPHTS
jgi:hypothetical protein